MFEDLKPTPPDPILGLDALFRADPSPLKVDLGIGIYRDEAGRSPVLECVKRAEMLLVAKQETKSYLSSAGRPEFNEQVISLLLGSDHAALRDGRVRCVQTPGGTGGLRAAADFVRRCKPGARIWVPDPTWSNHEPIFDVAGLSVQVYPYYDHGSCAVNVDGTIAALGEVGRDDVVVLHGCCHNPTGADLPRDAWRQIAEVLSTRGGVPLIDLAYQGFADGIDEDAFGVRLLAGVLPELIIVSSFSKNFAIYRERTGALCLVARNVPEADTARSQLMQILRANWSMPPDHGAAVVALVLADQALRTLWLEELAVMRQRIQGIRARFADTLSAKSDRDFSAISRQRGMFSLMAVPRDGASRLQNDHHVYISESGRLNLAGLTHANVEYVGSALAAVLR